MRRLMYLSFFACQAVLLPQLKSGAGFAEAPKWEKLSLPETLRDRDLNGAYFLDDHRGWIVGDQGLCLKTEDAGHSWQIQKTDSNATLRCVQFRNAQTGWICGDGDRRAPVPRGHVMTGPMNSGTLLHTKDGGKTWKAFWIPTNFQIPWIETSAAPLLQVAVNGTFVHPDGDSERSRDGGKTWTWDRCYRALLAVKAVDAKRWVAVGSRVAVGFDPVPTSELYSAQACRALYSDDGGSTWQVSQGSDGEIEDGFLTSLAVGGRRTLFAVGDHGVILRSGDAGGHWEKMASPSTTNLRSVAWCEPCAVAVGKRGVVLVSSKDGRRWQRVPTGLRQTLNCVAPAGSDVIIVGQRGAVLRSPVAALVGEDTGRK